MMDVIVSGILGVPSKKAVFSLSPPPWMLGTHKQEMNQYTVTGPHSQHLHCWKKYLGLSCNRKTKHQAILEQLFYTEEIVSRFRKRKNSQDPNRHF